MINLCKDCVDSLSCIEGQKFIRDSKKICSRCFGILGESFITKIVDDIAYQIAGKYTGTNAVSFAVSLPVPIKIRQVLIESIIDEFKSSSLKENFKKRLSFCWKGSAVVSDQECDVVVTITFNCQEELGKVENEFFFNNLIRLPIENQSKKKQRLASSINFNTVLADTKVIDNIKDRSCMIENYFCNEQINFVLEEPGWSISLKSKSIFIAGLYNKYDRNVSQTPWIIDGKLKTEKSVSGLIETALCQIFSFSATKFCSAGREDADVRMLGEGRPFLLELIDVCRWDKVHYYISNSSELQNDFNSLYTEQSFVTANKLCIVDGAKANCVLKRGEEEKQKVYRCLIWSEREINDDLLRRYIDDCSEFEIQQTTPIRVLQRRALLTRKKRVIEMASQAIDKHYFILHIRTDAGTYIKEFVHGDLGRTVPSLKNILWPSDSNPPACDILELDVLSVELAGWPPSF